MTPSQAIAKRSASIRIFLKYTSRGQFAEAGAPYRKILKSEPNYSDSPHFLGLIALQEGRIPYAANLMGRAIAINPDDANALNNLG